MTRRLIHVENTQVLMETQFEVDKYGGSIFRPAVIPRHCNQGISTNNFRLVCEGKIGSRVLEDEMYMSEIIMMAEDMSMDWHRFPLEQCPSLNIYWEYGVFYPMSRYFSPLVSNHHEGEGRSENSDGNILNELKKILRMWGCIHSADVHCA
jgi:hypothetical protein